MEFILPVIAIGGAYMASKNSKQKDDTTEHYPHKKYNEGFRTHPDNSIVATNEVKEVMATEADYKDYVAEQIYNPATHGQNGYGQQDHPNLSRAIPGQAPIQFPGGAWSDKYIGADPQSNMPMGHSRVPKDMDMSIPHHGSLALEKRMGYNSSTKPKKKEQFAMFAPEKNITFPNGAPAMTSILQNREFVGTNMKGISPIPAAHQASAVLTTEDGSLLNAGFNGGMNRGRDTSRTVDQLRTAANPKFGGSKYATYEGLEGPANAPIKKGLQREQVGTAEQRTKTDSSYERGEKWMTPAGGSHQGHKSVDNAQPANVRKAESESWMAPANSEVRKPIVHGIQKPCTKNVYGAGPSPLAGGILSGSNGVANTFSRPTVSVETKRTAYENTNYIGAVHRAVSGAVASLLTETPKETFRQMYSESSQQYSAPRTEVSSQPRRNEYSSENRPGLTMRDLAAQAVPFLQITAGKSGEGYISSQTQAATTNRHSTGNKPPRYGSAAAPCQTYSREPEYAREVRDTHNCTLHSTRAGGGLGLHNAHSSGPAYVKDDARQHNQYSGYVRGPAAIPSASQQGIHSILEYDYHAPVENSRVNIDRSKYNNIHSGLTMKSISEGMAKTQSV